MIVLAPYRDGSAVHADPALFTRPRIDDALVDLPSRPGPDQDTASAASANRSISETRSLIPGSSMGKCPHSRSMTTLPGVAMRRRKRVLSLTGGQASLLGCTSVTGVFADSGGVCRYRR